jgi:histidinol-phosphate aminotransferase
MSHVNKSQPRPFAHLVRSELTALHAYAAPYGYTPSSIRLDANESAWDVPEPIKRDVAEQLATDAWHRYPDSRATALREAIADTLDAGGADSSARADRLVLGAGSDELIAMLATALAKPRPKAAYATVLYPDPTFAMYGITSTAHGLLTTTVPLTENWDLSVLATMEAIAEWKPNVAYFASPNNPTGNAWKHEALRSIAAAAKDTLVVIDEAYVAYAESSVLGWASRMPNVAVLGTLSKIGLAGLRVGWAYVPIELAAELEKVRQPYNVNRLSQIAATRVLRHHREWLDASVKRTKDERAWLQRELRAIPWLHVYPTDANFFLVRVNLDAVDEHDDPAHRVADALLKSDIHVKRFASAHARLRSHLRISVGTRQEHEQLLDALRAFQG